MLSFNFYKKNIYTKKKKKENKADGKVVEYYGIQKKIKGQRPAGTEKQTNQLRIPFRKDEERWHLINIFVFFSSYSLNYPRSPSRLFS
jgi:hypothetical protein